MPNKLCRSCNVLTPPIYRGPTHQSDRTKFLKISPGRLLSDFKIGASSRIIMIKILETGNDLSEIVLFDINCETIIGQLL